MLTRLLPLFLFSLSLLFSLLAVLVISHFSLGSVALSNVSQPGAAGSRLAAAAWLERCLPSSRCEMKMALMAVAVTVATSSPLPAVPSPLLLFVMHVPVNVTFRWACPTVRAAGKTKGIKEAPMSTWTSRRSFWPPGSA